MFFFKENFSLLHFNTFGIDAFARYFATFESVDDLLSVLSKCHELGIKSCQVLGGGSNTIFTDSFEGLVIRNQNKTIEQVEPDLVVAGGGVEWDELVEATIEKFGLQGLENLSGIPGSVGASPVQNVGAYGVEAGDMVEWVDFYDPQVGMVVRMQGVDCGFGYRSSIFKKEFSGVVVLRVAFRLNEIENADFRVDYGDLRAQVEGLGGLSASNIRCAVLAIRSSKLPDPKILGNAGSFFKNPVISVSHFERLRSKYPDIPSYDVANGVKVPAGWLIDRAGLKGYRQGAVGVHERQALVIVNHGGATADEILFLATHIEDRVFDQYGIRLEKEVTVV